MKKEDNLLMIFGCIMMFWVIFRILSEVILNNKELKITVIIVDIILVLFLIIILIIYVIMHINDKKILKKRINY